jgi:F-type H+-transporting ATPase subunit gamma
MTHRLADVSARIQGIRQLGMVVNAIRGIAAARALQARNQLISVDSYANTIAAAISHAMLLAPVGRSAGSPKSVRSALVVFCAEQGFAGAFSERVLDAVATVVTRAELFLVGTRGQIVAAERAIAAGWKGAMPAHSTGIPKLADRIAEALYARIAMGEIDQLDAVFSQKTPGQSLRIERRCLFPVNLTAFPLPANADAPLLNLSPDLLLAKLTADYVHAQLCSAALHAFAAENETRMEAMASAHTQIERQLSQLQATQQHVRQEEITAEIIELAAGETASRSGRRTP